MVFQRWFYKNQNSLVVTVLWGNLLPKSGDSTFLQEWSHKACLSWTFGHLFFSRPVDTYFFVPFLPFFDLFFHLFQIPVPNWRSLRQPTSSWSLHSVTDRLCPGVGSQGEKVVQESNSRKLLKKVIQESYWRELFKKVIQGGTRIYYREVDGRFDPVVEVLI